VLTPLGVSFVQATLYSLAVECRPYNWFC